MQRREDLDLRGLNSFGIAARAAQAWFVESIDDLDALGGLLADRPDPLVIGAGSNVLLARDVTEPLLLMRIGGRRIVADDGERVDVDVAGGESWDATVRWSLAQGLFGLENLALIPGTVGAAPWQNIGAYGVEIASRVAAVTAWHRPSGRLRRFAREDCRFGYRDSFFKQAEGRDWLIVTVHLALSRRPEPNLGYGELAAELAGTIPTPPAVADAVTRIRRRKLPDPAVLGNAGSFFKNPILDAPAADALRSIAPGVPLFDGGDGRRKAAAGWLIEACGWKGFREGDAGVSPAHALVLVNHGRATGAELLRLARRIQDSVAERFGVRLEPEPTIVG